MAGRAADPNPEHSQGTIRNGIGGSSGIASPMPAAKPSDQSLGVIGITNLGRSASASATDSQAAPTKKLA